mgnify:CR=1 FL=1
MDALATYKYAHISAQKVRLVIDQIRGMDVEQASTLLRFSPKKAAAVVKKVLDSAIANAEHNEGADIDDLRVVRAYADVGPTMKRFRARARGRGDRILKRSCHVTVVVGDSK